MGLCRARCAQYDSIMSIASNTVTASFTSATYINRMERRANKTRQKRRIRKRIDENQSLPNEKTK